MKTVLLKANTRGHASHGSTQVNLPPSPPVLPATLTDLE